MLIEINNVSKKFKKVNVLEEINLSFSDSHIYGLSGRNGSGKSVLLKIICGIYSPTNGSVLFDGKNFNQRNLFVPNVRAFIESSCFFPDLSGLDNLKVLAKIQNKIGEEEIFNALKIVNLFEEKDKKFSEYSVGMKQKLGIAQAIMENPHVLLLDEPFNGIEEATVKKILDYLIKEKNKGKIIVLSSHIKEDLNAVCDEIYHMDAGKVLSNNESI